MALPEILERVFRCRYCSREMAVSVGAYEENPFCAACPNGPDVRPAKGWNGGLSANTLSLSSLKNPEHVA